MERVLFALVANRALAPGSKLAAAGWVTAARYIDGLPDTSDDACYRAMDWLLDIAPDLEREVFWQVATLLDHEIDLLFFDYPANRRSAFSRWPGRWCCFAAFERADFFFLPADFCGDGVEGLGEVVDAVGQPGEGEQLAVPGAVAVDDRAEVAAAVAGGAADAGFGGDGGEGDVRAGAGQGFAGRADSGGVGAGVGGRVRGGFVSGWMSVILFRRG